MARHGGSRAGQWPVQLRHETAHTSEEYVSHEGWRNATLARCPLHPGGGCGFARHATYARVWPAGMRVARFYCPLGRVTFSLLPDCLASRFSGSLDALEATVVAVEESRAAGATMEAAAAAVRPEVDVVIALRWVYRRLTPIRQAVRTLETVMPLLAGAAGQLSSVRSKLATKRALVSLRSMASPHTPQLPPPLGYGPRVRRRRSRRRRSQHETGADPPPGKR